MITDSSNSIITVLEDALINLSCILKEVHMARPVVVDIMPDDGFLRLGSIQWRSLRLLALFMAQLDESLRGI